MTNGMEKGASLAAALEAAVVLLASTALAPPAATEGSGDYPPPDEGDWMVSRNTTVSNERVHLRGNLSVGACSLTLDNVTLIGGPPGTNLSVAVSGAGSLSARRSLLGPWSSPGVDIRVSGAAELIDCALSGSERLYINGSCRTLGTALPTGSVSVLGAGRLDVFWRLYALVTYSGGAPAPGAQVTVTDALGRIVATAQTDAAGAAGPFELPELSRQASSSQLLTPYWVNASKGTLGRSLSVNLNRDIELILELQDRTPPWIRITSPANGTLTNLSTLELRGEAGDDVGLELVRVRFEGGEWMVASGRELWSARLELPDGRHTLEAEALDRAGHAASASISASVDTVPPLLIVTAPERGALVNTSVVDVAGEAEPGCQLTLNGLSVPVAHGSFAAAVALDEGENLIRLDAWDDAGNHALQTLEVELDSIPPWLSVAWPRPGELVNSSEIELKGTAEEGAAVLVQGAQARREGPFFSARVGLREGENGITVLAVDAACNSARVDIPVSLDSTPPQIRVDVVDGTVTLAPSLRVSGWTEPGSSLSLNGAPLAAGADGGFETDVALRLGANRLAFSARDAAGNDARVEVNIVREVEPEPPQKDGGVSRGTDAAPLAALAALGAALALIALIPYALMRMRER